MIPSCPDVTFELGPLLVRLSACLEEGLLFSIGGNDMLQAAVRRVGFPFAVFRPVQVGESRSHLGDRRAPTRAFSAETALGK